MVGLCYGFLDRVRLISFLFLFLNSNSLISKGFAKNAFSMSPSAKKANKIVLIGQYASYDCELHEDKCTETQLTCWTP